MMRTVLVCPVCSLEFGSGLSHCPSDGAVLVTLNRSEKFDPASLLGKVIEGRYRVERVVGKGGMGTVYACRHVVVGKAVAVKVLSPTESRSDAALQRFIREAQTTNLLKNRHFVEIGDFGQLPSGLLFLVMELLEGEDLAHALRARSLGRLELIRVFAQIAEALAEAHELGVVHRDLKPDNVFLTREPDGTIFVKLLDFGIAKLLDDAPSALTDTGVVLGTPYYMSPEQARGDLIDGRSDIYALGVIMYRAFTGRLPFIGDSKIGVLTRHITEPPKPPSELGETDLSTEQLILRCLQKDPDLRPQSMREVRLELDMMLVAEQARQSPTHLEARAVRHPSPRPPGAATTPIPTTERAPHGPLRVTALLTPHSERGAGGAWPVASGQPAGVRPSAAPSEALTQLHTKGEAPSFVDPRRPSIDMVTELHTPDGPAGVTASGLVRAATPRRGAVILAGMAVAVLGCVVSGALMLRGHTSSDVAAQRAPADAPAPDGATMTSANALATGPGPLATGSATSTVASSTAATALDADASGAASSPRAVGAPRGASSSATPKAAPRRPVGEIRSPFN
jgi:eukaryotic-like serine/threonine-protein kinase